MVNIISLLFLLFAMSVPSTAMADQPDARVLEDSEINACLQKCNAGGNACVDYSKCQSELAECRNLNEGWYAAYNTLAERCGSALATDSQHPPSKTLKSEPKKVSSGGKKWEPPQKVIVCAGGATKSKDGKYCECPDGVPARVLDKESHPNNNVYKAVCVPTMEMFAAERDLTNKRFNGLCGDSTEEACTETGKKVSEMYVWHHSLLFPKDKSSAPPLTRESWILLWDRQNEIERLYNELRAKDAEQDARIGKVENDVSGITDRLNQMSSFATGGVGPRLGYNWRPDATDSFVATLDATMTLWPSAKNGWYIGGFGGVSWNDDQNRNTVGLRTGYARDLTDDRTAVFHVGGVVAVEPVIKGHNDSTMIGGELALDWRPGGSWLMISPTVSLGGVQSAVYQGGDRSISPWGLALQPSLFIGGAF